jgi:protein TonB
MMRWLSAIAVGTALTLVSLAAPQEDKIKVSGSKQAAKIIRMTKPVYPPEAKEAGVEGVVRLRVTISAEGRVTEMETISGHQLLTPAAVEAVKQWEYEPTLLNGKPVAVLTDVDINFTLAKK